MMMQCEVLGEAKFTAELKEAVSKWECHHSGQSQDYREDSRGWGCSPHRHVSVCVWMCLI